MTKAESKRKPDELQRAELPREITSVVDAAHDKKASDVVVLDLRKSHAFTDFFILCSGQNARQVNAIVDAIETALGGVDVKPNHVEGRERAEWVLLDCFDFIVHVFTPDTRAFYGLERLWGSAERIEMPARA